MAPVCTASQINLLVYHYLKESGFNHACFSMRHEGRLDEDPLSKEAVVEPGQLVKIMQKGLLYLAVEAHVNADGTEKACSAPFSLVGPPHVCDGVARVSPAQQVLPSRLTPTPPPVPSPSTRIDTSVQTQIRSKSQSRASSLAPIPPTASPLQANGTHEGREAAMSPFNVASSSKTKLDSGTTPTESVEAQSGKRKSTTGAGKLSKGEKRVKRIASPQVNGAQIASDDETEETESTNASVAAPAKKSKKASNATKTASSGPNGNGKGSKAGASAYIPPLSGKAKGKEIASDKMAKLKGHSAEVFLSAWNPTVPGLLASGAGDATVRIWDIGSANDLDDASSTIPAVCKHLPATHSKDVPALSWNPDGTLLASGSYDGILRLWTPQGDLHLVMSMHQGPIFAVRWNRKGNLILSGSADGTAIVWDLGSGKVRQQFSLHSDSVLDIDWLTASINFKGTTPSAAADATLATCSADNSINILKLSENKPLKVLRGHTDEVNAIRFDPTGTLLASVSDDMTARVWSVDAILGSNYLGISNGDGGHNSSQTRILGKRNSATPRSQRGGSGDQMEVDEEGEKDENDSMSFDAGNTSLGSNGNGNSYCKHVLSGHKKDIFSVAWAPHQFGSEEPRLLATASFDHTARIWNAEDGSCLRIFKEHTDSVYSVCFSPDRRFLLSGGMDHRLFISSVATGDIVMAYAGGGGIFDIALPIDGSNRKEILDAPSNHKVGNKTKVKEEDASTLAQNTAQSSKGILGRHHIALSQADRTVTILDIGSLMASSSPPS